MARAGRGAPARRLASKRAAGAPSRFLTALGVGTPSGDLGHLDAAIDALLDESPPPAADLAGAAVALGCAVDALGGADVLPVAGPMLVLVTVPTAAWVEPVAVVLRHHVEASRRGRLPGWEGEGEPIVMEGAGTTGRVSPAGRDAEVLDALRRGGLVVGVSADPKRWLPGNLVRGAELCIAIPPLGTEAIRLVVEAVTGSAPRDAVPARLAEACEPDDLVLAVHAVRGADASVARLAKLLADKVDPAAAGPCLEELCGYGEAKAWGLALLEDLRAWRSGAPGAPGWADLESAILLSGPPGVGKTTFAAALARSAGLPLLAGSLAQWQSARDGHLGHTLGAMRAFFERARQSPCVVLIDEVDAFGDRRAFRGDHVAYGTQVVDALLEHLDGATSREGVVVVAATNDPDSLDPALLRPGRLERHVRVPLPDADAIAGILRHALGKALPGMDLSHLSRRLEGLSGADVADVVRRARGAARRGRRPFVRADLEGLAERMRPPLPPATRARIAVHEAGHLLAAAALGAPGDLSASIGYDGGVAGLNLGPDGGMSNEGRLDGCLVVMLAGRAAEEIAFGDATTGSVEDLAWATRLAVDMETRLGFSSRMPLLAFGRGKPEDALGLPWVAAAVTERLGLAYDRALDLLRIHRRELDRLAEGLRREGQLDAAKVRRLLGRRFATASRDHGRCFD
ncbi:AAA family ATPase [Methylobacterium mesophilicum]